VQIFNIYTEMSAEEWTMKNEKNLTFPLKIKEGKKERRERRASKN